MDLGLLNVFLYIFHYVFHVFEVVLFDLFICVCSLFYICIHAHVFFLFLVWICIYYIYIFICTRIYIYVYVYLYFGMPPHSWRAKYIRNAHCISIQFNLIYIKSGWGPDPLHVRPLPASQCGSLRLYPDPVSYIYIYLFFGFFFVVEFTCKILKKRL